jgi:hypothetical protein
MKKLQFAQAVVLSGLLAFPSVAAPSSVAAPHCKAPATLTVPLQGSVLFHVYSMQENRAIVDPDQMYTVCAAELVVRGRHNVVLRTTEWIDFGPEGGGLVLFRKLCFRGTLTACGQLKFTWPEEWLEMNWATGKLEPSAYPNIVAQIESHTGYDIFGPQINKDTVELVGTFDGQKLFAGLHVFGFQEKPGAMGPPYDVVVDGPIEFSMWLDLNVSE